MKKGKGEEIEWGLRSHPDQPLPASGEGRQSVALAGWGSWGERK